MEPGASSISRGGKELRMLANNSLYSAPLPFRILSSDNLVPAPQGFSTSQAMKGSTRAKKSPPPHINVRIANDYWDGKTSAPNLKGKDNPPIHRPANNPITAPLLFRTISNSTFAAGAFPAPTHFSANRAKVGSGAARKSPPPPIQVFTADDYIRASLIQRYRLPIVQAKQVIDKSLDRTVKFIIGPSTTPSPTSSADEAGNFIARLSPDPGAMEEVETTSSADEAGKFIARPSPYPGRTEEVETPFMWCCGWNC